MTIRELSSITNRYKEQLDRQQSSRITIVTPDEVRARNLLQNLLELNNQAFNERKQKWLTENPRCTVYEPSLDEVKRDITLDEWLYFFIYRISLTPEQRYHEALEVGSTEEEAIHEKDKFTLDILSDYKDYQDYDKALQIWNE